MPWPVKELDDVKSILKNKKLHIAQEEIFSDLARIEHSQQIFPQLQQKALLVQLLHTYENSRKKVVIQLEELGKINLPFTVIMERHGQFHPGYHPSKARQRPFCEGLYPGP
jgi:DNA-directed RNA polymerase subunit K/omega